MASILANLEACYGADRVVDVFENIGMALKARDLNIGCYVVRGVLTSAQLAAWHQALTDSVFFIANTKGPRAVDLKGEGRTSSVPHNPGHSWEMYLQVCLRGHWQAQIVQGLRG